MRLQWDPDHGPTGEKEARRAIQLGMSPRVIQEIWNTPQCILHIADITEFVASLRSKVYFDSGNCRDTYNEDLTFRLPAEWPYRLTDHTLARRIMVDDIEAHPAVDKSTRNKKKKPALVPWVPSARRLAMMIRCSRA